MNLELFNFKIMDVYVEVSKSPVLCVFNVHDKETIVHW